MKVHKTVLLLGVILCCTSSVFSQVPSAELHIRDKLALPWPLCLVMFKDRAFSIESKLVDSLIVPKTIKSLKIEKADNAWKLFGSRAKNGVVIISIDDNVASEEYNRLKPYLNKYGQVRL
jgi:hypothetical protein